MMSFRDNRWASLKLPTSTVWLLTDISEAKGKEALYTHQSPHVLRALRDAAMVQSAESSNRIEGVTVDPRRLRPLVLGHAKPRDRSEAEIQGYRRSLNLIHTTADRLVIGADLMCQLHATIQAESGDASQFKRIDNEIIEVRPGEQPVTRFRAVPAAATPAAIAELCKMYRHTQDQRETQPLLAVAALILDFLCIHPFRDGNGRVSRLLTLLALYQIGYEVGRYVSIERMIEEDKEGYYEALARSSQGWHEGKHDLMPWTNYLLATIRRSYLVFAERAGQVKAPRGAKMQAMLDALEHFESDFSLVDVEAACPGISRDWIRRMLHNLRSSGRVECIGRGPGARWRKRV